MKRSEMAKIITDNLKEIGKNVSFYGSADEIMQGGYDGEVFFKDEIGEHILDLIEAQGMLPPPLEFQMAGNTLRDNGWEPEQ